MRFRLVLIQFFDICLGIEAHCVLTGRDHVVGTCQTGVEDVPQSVDILLRRGGEEREQVELVLVAGVTTPLEDIV